MGEGWGAEGELSERETEIESKTDRRRQRERSQVDPGMDLVLD